MNRKKITIELNGREEDINKEIINMLMPKNNVQKTIISFADSLESYFVKEIKTMSVQHMPDKIIKSTSKQRAFVKKALLNINPAHTFSKEKVTYKEKVDRTVECIRQGMNPVAAIKKIYGKYDSQYMYKVRDECKKRGINYVQNRPLRANIEVDVNKQIFHKKFPEICFLCGKSGTALDSEYCEECQASIEKKNKAMI